MSRLIFNRKYAWLTLVLLVTEILIAVYVHDSIIRPYVGDLLVVILVYCFVRTWCNTSLMGTTIGVFLFACLVELAQYYDVAAKTGIHQNAITATITGNAFDWMDIVMYAAGCFIIILVEKSKSTRP